MRVYKINGGKPLSGSVNISGAKNSSLAIISAAIMNNKICKLYNVPRVSDVMALIEALKNIGVIIEWIDEHTLLINGNNINPNIEIAYDAIKKIRASYYLLGALLGKYKKAMVSLPGGCNIGDRPIDLHIKGFKMLGAKIWLSHGIINAKADELKGAEIFFDTISVGATINVMLAAALSEGRSILQNAATEPHVVDVANFLNSMGAKIKGAGTRTIVIDGVREFNRDVEYSIIPDQIEAGTFMVAAAMTKGNVTVNNVCPFHLMSITSKLKEMGAVVEEGTNYIHVNGPDFLTAINIVTMPHPGFPTDMQAQFAAACCVANGNSIIEENIFENRFLYSAELRRLGANIIQSDNIIVIDGSGGKFLSGAEVTACDLRAGAALVLAGLVSEGTTIIHNIEYIERGYEDFVRKLNLLNADIELIEKK